MKTIFILLSIFSVSSFASVIPNEPHIYVEGYAEKEITPDQIKISISIVSTNLDANLAKLEIDEKSLKIFEATKKLGIEANEITATPIQVFPAIETENGNKVDNGTRVSRGIDIVLKSLAKYPLLNDALISADITSKITSSVEMNDERAVKKSVLMLAVKDAKLKAQEIAEIQGKRLKGIYSVSEFKTRQEETYNLYPNQSIYGQSYGSGQVRYRVPPKSSVFEIGKMRATATVYVVYTIE
ncbi:SIMPL domain-containing protein [Pseudoalteromonas sp. PS5]|uniref:SIMPL domain-containing protein n=1 Tax=Pseudoalteromonas sp. PS5 TaxID=1437473 RepID=UPI000FFF3A51|nr:SIMPL domain-containing protein [Pseudoalteromonas sp. PS5]RXF05358.1 DUF541 domain-containing protein [Pseudoalteromonas sp. PS5]